MVINTDNLCGCGELKSRDALMCNECAGIMAGLRFSESNHTRIDSNYFCECGNKKTYTAKKCRACNTKEIKKYEKDGYDRCSCGRLKTTHAKTCRRCYLKPFWEKRRGRWAFNATPVESI